MKNFDNMKNNILIAAVLLLSFSSCDLTEKPISYYEKETYFTTESKAKLAVIGAYSGLSTTKHYGQFEMATPTSDDIYYIKGTDTDNTRRDIAHYQVKSTNTWLKELWIGKYAEIDQANVAIAGIEAMPKYAESDYLKQLDAEARFLRAFLAFDIIKFWGDAPYKTTSTSNYASAFKGRVSREDIYKNIIEDLDFAKKHLLPANSTTSPEKPCRAAANALLMRVYLQRAGFAVQTDGTITRPDDDTRKKYFEKVIEEFKAIEDNGYNGFYEGGFVELFKGYSKGVLNQKESLWEIAFNPTGASYSENAGTWGTWNGPEVDAAKDVNANTVMGRANAFFRVLPAWKDFFEDTDVRRDIMVCTYKYKWDKKNKVHKKVENKIDNWYPGKWRREWMPLGSVNPNNVPVNYCPLRYADAVLMAAEAYNETGNTTEAWTLLNKVRVRANATPINAINYASLMKAPKVYNLAFIDDSDEAGKFRTALYWERGFELAFEGQRKYDLIRWGILGDALLLAQTKMPKALKGKYVAGDNFVKGKNELFPIPLDEMQVNPALGNVNNFGY